MRRSMRRRAGRWKAASGEYRPGNPKKRLTFPATYVLLIAPSRCVRGSLAPGLVAFVDGRGPGRWSSCAWDRAWCGRSGLRYPATRPWNRAAGAAGCSPPGRAGCCRQNLLWRAVAKERRNEIRPLPTHNDHFWNCSILRNASICAAVCRTSAIRATAFLPCWLSRPSGLSAIRFAAASAWAICPSRWYAP